LQSTLSSHSDEVESLHSDTHQWCLISYRIYASYYICTGSWLHYALQISTSTSLWPQHLHKCRCHRTKRLVTWLRFTESLIRPPIPTALPALEYFSPYDHLAPRQRNTQKESRRWERTCKFTALTRNSCFEELTIFLPAQPYCLESQIAFNWSTNLR